MGVTVSFLCQNDKISISIVNDQGQWLYFYRGINSGVNTIHTSYRKAYTAASLKVRTSVLSKMIEAPGFSQLGKMEDDILLLTGGVPIFYKKTLVGAIGLSGSSNPIEEEQCGIEAAQLLIK
ncbi:MULTISPECIES: heme-binding protein [unclassified Pseudoalteromonas]|uniref:GlcG/HbpS family heme-binding protein n=1 Tax=unclassified Pseudoalteromonas TaxID=194690 RepID=UPI003866313E